MNLDYKTIIVTGGAGFIGSNLIRYLINNTQASIVNVDKLTYAGNLHSLEDVQSNNRYAYEYADVQGQYTIESIFRKYQPIAVMHLEAESHVDRSIDGPAEFLNTNILGAFNMHFIYEEQLMKLVRPISKKSYGQYLMKLLRKINRS